MYKIKDITWKLTTKTEGFRLLIGFRQVIRAGRIQKDMLRIRETPEGWSLSTESGTILGTYPTANAAAKAA